MVVSKLAEYTRFCSPDTTTDETGWVWPRYVICGIVSSMPGLWLPFVRPHYWFSFLSMHDYLLAHGVPISSNRRAQIPDLDGAIVRPRSNNKIGRMKSHGTYRVKVPTFVSVLFPDPVFHYPSFTLWWFASASTSWVAALVRHSSGRHPNRWSAYKKRGPVELITAEGSPVLLSYLTAEICFHWKRLVLAWLRRALALGIYDGVSCLFPFFFIPFTHFSCLFENS